MVAIGPLIGPDVLGLIKTKRWEVLREVLPEFDPSDVAEILAEIPDYDDAALFRFLPREFAGRVFAHLPRETQETLLRNLSAEQVRSVIGELTPDDQARLLEELPAEVTRRLLAALAPEDLKAARDLLGYPPHTAGRYMTPRYLSLRPDLTAQEAINEVRRVGRDKETLNILYIVDESGQFRDELRLGSLVLADPAAPIAAIEDRPRVAIPATADREETLRAFKKYDRVALPVVDRDGKMLGIITADDILDVAEKEATEDIQKMGGMETLDAPYLDVSYARMVWKRGGWLTVLFIGETFTAEVMRHFEFALEKAAVVAMFIPLIISSGGNSGSQATTLIIRSLALAELRLRDWWRVLARELRSALTLGFWLGFVGFARIWLYQMTGRQDYGPHYLLIAATVWASLIGVVTFGSLVGSMFPFLLRRIGIDPATSSAPFVATFVDVTGLIIYFLIAVAILSGTLL